MFSNSKKITAVLISVLFIIVSFAVICDAAYAGQNENMNITSEEETQNVNIQNKIETKKLVYNNPFLSLMSSDIYTLQTNLENGFTMRSSKKTFDVWAKKNGMKMPAYATLFRINANGEYKYVREISVGWDDGSKTSFILDMSNQEGGEFSVKVWTGGDNLDDAAVVREYGFTYYKTPLGGYIGDIVIDIEAFTISLGYIEEPVRIPIYEGDNAAIVIDRFLKENHYEYDKTGSLTAGFYLGRIRELKSIDLSHAKLEKNVARVIDSDEWNAENYTEGSLGETDFTSDSGWMYSVNNVFPNVGMSEFYLEEGDVVRLQFTVAKGREIGGSGSAGGSYPDYYSVADKDELTSLLAEINSAINSQNIKDNQTAARLITESVQINENIAVEQDSVDEAYDTLKTYLGQNSESPSLSLNVSELTLRKGNSQTLEVTVGEITTLYPLYVQWSTEEAGIATVDSQGTVLAQKSGTTRITVSVGSSKARCKVTVEEIPLQGIKLVPVTLWSGGVDPYEQYKTKDGYKIPTSEWPLFMIEPVPADTTDDITPTYTVNTKKYMDISVMQNQYNICTAIGKHKGTTILTATVGKYSDQIEIEFYENKTRDFTCDDSEPVLSINGYNAVKNKVLTFSVEPSEAKDIGDVFFSSSDNSVFVVSYPSEQYDTINTINGTITKRIYARGEGVADLYVTIGNVTKTFPITVYDLKESDEIVPYGYDTLSQVYSSSGIGTQTGKIGGIRYRAGKEYKGTGDAGQFSVHLDDPYETLSFQGTTYTTHDFVCAGWGMDIYAKTSIWPLPELTGSSGTAVFTNKMYGKNRMITKITVSDTVVPVESIALTVEGNVNSETGNYCIGDEVDLSCTVNPTDSTGEVVWYSSDMSVAVVDQNGHLEIEGSGDADIVACIAGKYKIHNVHVGQPMTGMTISNKTLDLTSGVNRQLMAWCLPDDTTDNKTITWESSEPNVVSVDNKGKISTLQEGEATITASTEKYSVDCKVTVDNSKVRQIYFPDSPVYVETGDTVNLGAPMTEPKSAAAEADQFVWSSSDDSYATVDQRGNVTLHKASPVDRAGTLITREDYYYNCVKIYAEKDGVKGTCIIETGSPMTGLDMSAKEVTIYKGDEIELEALFLPEDTTEDRSGITWTSSNGLVASQREIGENFSAYRRYVVGNKPGDAVITAHCGEFTASCKVKVILPPAQQAAYDLQKKIEGWCELDPVTDRAEYISIGKDIMETWKTFTDEQKRLVGGYNEYFAEHVDEILQMEADDEAAAGVTVLINEIGEVSLTDSSRQKIAAAREAYNSLTDTQKSLISSDVLAVLTQAENRLKELEDEEQNAEDLRKAGEVKALIEAIGEVTLTEESSQKITLARYAYDNLTASQKALVSSDTLGVLTAAENRYKELQDEKEKQDKEDRQKAAAVDQLIDAWRVIGPASDRAEYVSKGLAIQSAWENLTNAQKALVTGYSTYFSGHLDEIIMMKYDDDTAANVVDLIGAIGEVSLTGDSSQKILSARYAYESLTGTQKALISQETLDILTAAENRLKELEDENDKPDQPGDPDQPTNEDRQKAEAVDQLIDAWREIDPGSDRAEYISKGLAIQEAYQDLTDVQKKLVTGYDTYFKGHLNEIIMMKYDDEAAANVADLIGAIGEVSLTGDSSQKITSARYAYDSLTESQKALISSETLGVLTAAEKRYKDLSEEKAGQDELDRQKASAVDNLITAWMEIDPAVDRARYVSEGLEIQEAWKGLTDAQKALVTGYGPYFSEHLNEITIMKYDDDAAARMEELIKEIGEVALTDESSQKISAARAAYDGLTDAQKALVPSETLSALAAAESRLKELEDGKDKPDQPDKPDDPDDGKDETDDAVKAAGDLKVKGLKVTCKARKFTVSWTKNKKASGYQVQYRKKGAKKFSNLKKATTKLKVKSKKLKKGKKYQFRVRTYKVINGKKVYGKWTKVKTVKCK